MTVFTIGREHLGLDGVKRRCAVLALIFALGACGSSKPASNQQSPAQANGGTIVVRMSDFAFDPAHLVLKAGQPVRLRLVNDSGGGHDLSAPALFAASTFPPGASMPPDGSIDVGSHQTAELTFVPRTPGKYPLECTHFMHSLFGMEGTIEVAP